jgi:acetyltransferase-like isoleucine patch superfamily enzyme
MSLVDCHISFAIKQFIYENWRRRMTWISDAEIKKMGFCHVGSNVLIDSSVVIFGHGYMSLGSNVRIDANVVLAAGPGTLTIGSNVHIGVATSIHAGASDVQLSDYVGLSAGVRIFSARDDFSNGSLTGPTVPKGFRGEFAAKVVLKEHAIVGSNSVIMPGVEVGFGASIGALTFVHRTIPAGTIVTGNPMRKIGMRNMKRLEELGVKLVSSYPSNDRK